MKRVIHWREGVLLISAGCVLVCGFLVNVVAADDDEKKAATQVVKLEKIVVPAVEFVDTPLRDVLDFLSARAVELDPTADDPSEKGVNFILRDRESLAPNGITLKLRNATMAEILRHVAEQSDARLVFDPYAVKLQKRADRQPVAPLDFGRSESAEETAKTKLRAIFIPLVEFADTPIDDALDFLRLRARELDDQTRDSNQKGINIVYPALGENAPRVTLKAKKLPLGEALRYTVELAGMSGNIEGSAFVVRAGD